MCVDILLQHSQAISQHNDLMKKHIDRNFFWFLCFIGGLQQHHSISPAIAQGNIFSDASPESQDLQKRFLNIRMSFDLFGYIFRNDLFEMGVSFVNLLYTMIDK